MSTPIIAVSALAAFTLFMVASLLSIAPSQAAPTSVPVAAAAQPAQANG